jgi:nucleoside-diphosphate-sugar epimerase
MENSVKCLACSTTKVLQEGLPKGPEHIISKPTVGVQLGEAVDIAVTGASGFIGTRLSKYLHHRGYHVTAVVRCPEQAQRFHGSGINTHVCDLVNPTALEPLFKGVDAVFHLAALFNWPEMTWDDYYRVNVDGTMHVMQAAERSGVGRVVHCSTVGVATGSGSPPYSEQIPYSPAQWDKYETTKCEGKKAALDFHRESGLPVVVIRPAQVYGPGDKSKAKFYQVLPDGRKRHNCQSR